MLVGELKPIEDENLLIQFTVYDDNNLPTNVYTMALGIKTEDVVLLNTLVNQLYIEKLSEEYLLPPIHLN